jgi:hypothetical protein
MKMLLAIVLLIGFASFSAARAECEILDGGTAVYAGATTSSTTAVATATSQ